MAVVYGKSFTIEQGVPYSGGYLPSTAVVDGVEVDITYSLTEVRDNVRYDLLTKQALDDVRGGSYYTNVGIELQFGSRICYYTLHAPYGVVATLIEAKLKVLAFDLPICTELTIRDDQDNRVFILHGGNNYQVGLAGSLPFHPNAVDIVFIG